MGRIAREDFLDLCRHVRETVTAREVALDLLGEPVKREAKREWWFCPFHGPEKRPSFAINPDRPGLAHCFSCGRNFTSIDIYMRLTGTDNLREAVHEMIRRYRLDEPSRPRRPIERRERSVLAELIRAEVQAKVQFKGKTPPRAEDSDGKPVWDGLTRHGFSRAEVAALAETARGTDLFEQVWLTPNSSNLVARMLLPVAGEWTTSGFALRKASPAENEPRHLDVAGSTRGLTIIRPKSAGEVKELWVFEGIRDLLSHFLRFSRWRGRSAVFVCFHGALSSMQEAAFRHLLEEVRPQKVFAAVDRDAAGEKYLERIRVVAEEAGGMTVVDARPPESAGEKDWFAYWHPSSSDEPSPTPPPRPQRRERKPAPPLRLTPSPGQ